MNINNGCIHIPHLCQLSKDSLTLPFNKKNPQESRIECMLSHELSIKPPTCENNRYTIYITKKNAHITYILNQHNGQLYEFLKHCFPENKPLKNVLGMMIEIKKVTSFNTFSLIHATCKFSFRIFEKLNFINNEYIVISPFENAIKNEIYEFDVDPVSIIYHSNEWKDHEVYPSLLKEYSRFEIVDYPIYPYNPDNREPLSENPSFPHYINSIGRNISVFFDVDNPQHLMKLIIRDYSYTYELYIPPSLETSITNNPETGKTINVEQNFINIYAFFRILHHYLGHKKDFDSKVYINLNLEIIEENICAFINLNLQTENKDQCFMVERLGIQLEYSKINNLDIKRISNSYQDILDIKRKFNIPNETEIVKETKSYEIIPPNVTNKHTDHPLNKILRATKEDKITPVYLQKHITIIMKQSKLITVPYDVDYNDVERSLNDLFQKQNTSQKNTTIYLSYIYDTEMLSLIFEDTDESHGSEKKNIKLLNKIPRNDFLIFYKTYIEYTKENKNGLDIYNISKHKNPDKISVILKIPNNNFHIAFWNEKTIHVKNLDFLKTPRYPFISLLIKLPSWRISFIATHAIITDKRTNDIHDQYINRGHFRKQVENSYFVDTQKVWKISIYPSDEDLIVKLSINDKVITLYSDITYNSPEYLLNKFLYHKNNSPSENTRYMISYLQSINSDKITLCCFIMNSNDEICDSFVLSKLTIEENKTQDTDINNHCKTIKQQFQNELSYAHRDTLNEVTIPLATVHCVACNEKINISNTVQNNSSMKHMLTAEHKENIDAQQRDSSKVRWIIYDRVTVTLSYEGSTDKITLKYFKDGNLVFQFTSPASNPLGIMLFKAFYNIKYNNEKKYILLNTLENPSLNDSPEEHTISLAFTDAHDRKITTYMNAQVALEPKKYIEYLNICCDKFILDNEIQTSHELQYTTKGINILLKKNGNDNIVIYFGYNKFTILNSKINNTKWNTLISLIEKYISLDKQTDSQDITYNATIYSKDSNIIMIFKIWNKISKSYIFRTQIIFDPTAVIMDEILDDYDKSTTEHSLEDDILYSRLSPNLLYNTINIKSNNSIPYYAPKSLPQTIDTFQERKNESYSINIIDENTIAIYLYCSCDNYIYHKLIIKTNDTQIHQTINDLASDNKMFLSLKKLEKTRALTFSRLIEPLTAAKKGVDNNLSNQQEPKLNIIKTIEIPYTPFIYDDENQDFCIKLPIFAMKLADPNNTSIPFHIDSNLSKLTTTVSRKNNNITIISKYVEGYPTKYTVLENDLENPYELNFILTLITANHSSGNVYIAFDQEDKRDISNAANYLISVALFNKLTNTLYNIQEPLIIKCEREKINITSNHKDNNEDNNKVENLKCRHFGVLLSENNHVFFNEITPNISNHLGDILQMKPPTYPHYKLYNTTDGVDLLPLLSKRISYSITFSNNQMSLKKLEYKTDSGKSLNIFYIHDALKLFKSLKQLYDNCDNKENTLCISCGIDQHNNLCVIALILDKDMNILSKPLMQKFDKMHYGYSYEDNIEIGSEDLDIENDHKLNTDNYNLVNINDKILFHAYKCDFNKIDQTIEFDLPLDKLELTCDKNFTQYHIEFNLIKNEIQIIHYEDSNDIIIIRASFNKQSPIDRNELFKIARELRIINPQDCHLGIATSSINIKNHYNFTLAIFDNITKKLKFVSGIRLSTFSMHKGVDNLVNKDLETDILQHRNILKSYKESKIDHTQLLSLTQKEPYIQTDLFGNKVKITVYPRSILITCENDNNDLTTYYIYVKNNNEQQLSKLCNHIFKYDISKEIRSCLYIDKSDNELTDDKIFNKVFHNIYILLQSSSDGKKISYIDPVRAMLIDSQIDPDTLHPNNDNIIDPNRLSLNLPIKQFSNIENTDKHKDIAKYKDTKNQKTTKADKNPEYKLIIKNPYYDKPIRFPKVYLYTGKVIKYPKKDIIEQSVNITLDETINPKETTLNNLNYLTLKEDNLNKINHLSYFEITDIGIYTDETMNQNVSIQIRYKAEKTAIIFTNRLGNTYLFFLNETYQHNRYYLYDCLEESHINNNKIGSYAINIPTHDTTKVPHRFSHSKNKKDKLKLFECKIYRFKENSIELLDTLETFQESIYSLPSNGESDINKALEYSPDLYPRPYNPLTVFEAYSFEIEDDISKSHNTTDNLLDNYENINTSSLTADKIKFSPEVKYKCIIDNNLYRVKSETPIVSKNKKDNDDNINKVFHVINSQQSLFLISDQKPHSLFLEFNFPNMINNTNILNKIRELKLIYHLSQYEICNYYKIGLKRCNNPISFEIIVVNTKLNKIQLSFKLESHNNEIVKRDLSLQYQLFHLNNINGWNNYTDSNVLIFTTYGLESKIIEDEIISENVNPKIKKSTNNRIKLNNQNYHQLFISLDIKKLLLKHSSDTYKINLHDYDSITNTYHILSQLISIYRIAKNHSKVYIGTTYEHTLDMKNNIYKMLFLSDENGKRNHKTILTLPTYSINGTFDEQFTSFSMFSYKNQHFDSITIKTCHRDNNPIKTKSEENKEKNKHYMESDIEVEFCLTLSNLIFYKNKIPYIQYTCSDHDIHGVWPLVLSEKVSIDMNIETKDNSISGQIILLPDENTNVSTSLNDINTTNSLILECNNDNTAINGFSKKFFF